MIDNVENFLFGVCLEVKEQGLCTVWNLSVDENIRVKIANSELLPLLIKFLEDEDVQVKEAAGGVLSNLALSNSNHKIMVEAGVIPKLVRLTSYLFYFGLGNSLFLVCYSIALASC